MVQWGNTPFDDVIQAALNLYPDIECEIYFVQDLKERENAYGATQFCDDGTIYIELDANTTVVHLIEILAHELAHVVVNRSEEDDHGEKWEKVFEEIFQEYNRYGEEKYLEDPLSYYNGYEGALRLIADIAYGYDNQKSEEGLKELIDEIRNEALKALKSKDK